MNRLKNKMGMRVLTLALCAALSGSVLAVKAESVAGETVVQEAVQDENMSESRKVDHPAQEAAEPDGQTETGEATEEPTDELTAEPSNEPTTEPTDEPTAEPTEQPTTEPTAQPTDEPTAEPSAEPSAEPTTEPTQQPTTCLLYTSRLCCARCHMSALRCTGRKSVRRGGWRRERRSPRSFCIGATASCRYCLFSTVPRR